MNLTQETLYFRFKELIEDEETCYENGYDKLSEELMKLTIEEVELLNKYFPYIRGMYDILYPNIQLRKEIEKLKKHKQEYMKNILLKK